MHSLVAFETTGCPGGAEEKPTCPTDAGESWASEAQAELPRGDAQARSHAPVSAWSDLSGLIRT